MSFKFKLKRRTFISLVVVSLSIIFALGIWLSSAILQAGTEHNVTGYAWSENIGWISFNNTTGGGGVNYGVNIDPLTGIFSGYAWSRGTDADVGGVGWISFNQTDLTGCPSGTCRAEVNLDTGEVSGWARALAFGGGWDGWIKLRGTNYGVSLNSSTKEFEGWAWGDTVVGWISFNHLNCDSNNDGVSDQGNYSQCPIGQPVADYKVKASLNSPPTATNLSVDQGNYCSYPPQAIFSWTFSDSDPGDTQGAYQVQVDGIDSGKVLSASQSYASPISFSYKTSYWWQLKVWDNYDAESIWISGPSFTTPLHIYPEPDFTWSPPSPTEREVVQLCAVQESGVCPENVSTCYDINNNPISCSGKTFLWTFPAGTEFATGSSATSENPRIKFDSTGVKDVTLEITDDVGTCPGTKTIGITLPLPRWREVAP